MSDDRAPRVERAIIIAGALIAVAIYFSGGFGRYQHHGQGLILDTKTGRVCEAMSSVCADFGERPTAA